MNKRRLITSVIVSLVGLNALLQAGGTRPRLVVNIVVDQLRTSDLEYLQSLFGQKGFNRLMHDGVYLRDVQFDTDIPDIANSTAILVTGANSARNGVASEYVFDADSKRMVKTLTDKHYTGLSTSESLSPTGLRLSTLSDEIAVGGDGLSLIYSIAADPQQALLLAGHAATGAVWLDANSGRWASSSYYKGLPAWATQRNSRAPLSSRLDTLSWRPLLNTSLYKNVSEAKRQRPFHYTFKSGRDVYSNFAHTPPANREITDMAIDCITSMRLGSRYTSSDKSAALGEPIDVLNIGYTLNPAPVVSTDDYLMEQQDAYIRLDGQLSRLFDAIDRTTGLDNSLIVLSSTGYYNEKPTDNEKYRIPGGDFSARRAASLLNSYLSATFGTGEYVSHLVNGHLYLDRKEIERKGLQLTKVAQEARDFLLKMSGIEGAYTLQDLANPMSDTARRLARTVDPKTSGDVILTYLPGWDIHEDYTYPETIRSITSAATVTPAFIFGAGIEPQVVTPTVPAEAIAPTVTQILRIRSPNGAGQRPLLLQ